MRKYVGVSLMPCVHEVSGNVFTFLTLKLKVTQWC